MVARRVIDMAKKVLKNKGQATPPEIKTQFNMKVVTVDTCIACKTQCERGIQYIAKMSLPGAIGRGVPCILTKGKGYK